jgi:methylated-DNA-[protein]-cysteine S-methyltransferase
MDKRQLKRLQETVGTPVETAVTTSREQVQRWLAQTAPLIQWDVIGSPLGPLYIAASARGLCKVDFGISQEEFLSKLDPSARIRQNPAALAPIAKQLQAYFSDAHLRFDIPLDLSRATPFQSRVLETARSIPPGTVQTYGQIARSIGKPRASRAVGQALGWNPIPIVIPCHRVVGSDGGLRGYGGGGGLKSKRFLLELEGAL